MMLELLFFLPLAVSGIALMSSSDSDDDGAQQGQDYPEQPEPDENAVWPSGQGTPGDDVIYTSRTVYSATDAGAGNDLVFSGTGGAVGGGDGNDTLVGSDDGDRLDDTAGNNLLFGGGGTDVIDFASGSIATGGADSDLFRLYIDLEGDSPATIADFTEGEDVIGDIYIPTASEQIDEFAGQVWDDGQGVDLYSGEVLIASVAGGQNIDASTLDVIYRATADTVVDNSGNAIIRAEGVDQTIHGGDGDDRITQQFNSADTGAEYFLGGEGNDTLFAVGANDTARPQLVNMPRLDGGAGDDVLVNQNGGMIMTGGEGADKFGVGRGNIVTEITDFDPAEDVIYVSEFNMNAPVSINVWADNSGADVVVNGTVVAHVTGGQSLTAADIRLSPDLGIELLGY